MEKINLSKLFSYRLRDALIDAGFHSPRSSSGVCVQKLVEITGYSSQICRKYLRGEVLPEPTKLMEIAEKLKVSPGWLLFGDDCLGKTNEKFFISQKLLHYIFKRACKLYQCSHSSEEVADFLLDLIQDVTQINATDEQSKKIVDLAISSSQHFGNR